jgi:predicted phage terminase large subunit-like protein
MSPGEIIELRPNPGPQEQFLSSNADIAVYGGQAGGGKSYALLLDPLRFKDVQGFGAVIFRRNATDLTQEGGLWDESMKIYPPVGGRPRESMGKLDYRFGSKSRISFAHLAQEDTVDSKQGGQIPMIGFDELCHFTKYQFFYMLSRNRSNCGIKPYMRGTCNPDPDSWVADFLAWWIDQNPKLANGEPNPNYGHAIPERSGKIRWMAKIDDDIHWFDKKEDAEEFMINAGRTPRPLSVTFIHATLDDNPKMNGRDDYISKLEALDRISRERLLKGNWKVRATAGLVFKRSDFKIMEIEDFNEKEVVRRVRRWDFAGTEAAKASTPGRMSAQLVRGPDWTVGLKLVQMRNKDIVVVDMIRCQKKSGDVEELVKDTAKADGRKVHVIIPQDPGQAGKAQVEHYVKMLMGYTVYHDRETGSKLVRATPYAAYAQHGHVYLLRAVWNDVFLAEHEAFPTDGVPDDIVDTGSGGYLALTKNGPSTAELMARNRVKMQ